MVTHSDILGAYNAWNLAITEAIHWPKYPSTESIENIAKAYGKRITTEEALEEVSEWFDWDKITEYLRNKK